MIPIMYVELYATSHLYEVLAVSTYSYMNDNTEKPKANTLFRNAV